MPRAAAKPDTTAPNNRLQATGTSLRSCVASAARRACVRRTGGLSEARITLVIR